MVLKEFWDRTEQSLQVQGKKKTTDLVATKKQIEEMKITPEEVK